MNMMISYQELVRTFLNNNLLEVTNSGQDPLRNALAIKDGSRWTRDILWSEDNHFRSATLSSTFSFAGLEWICPYISRHLLSLNPLQARCRRYSRGER